MQSRRTLLQKLGIGAAAAATGVGASQFTEVAKSRQLRAFADGGDASGAPWWLVAPLQPGTRLSDGWTLTDLSAVERGAAVLDLARHDGTQARVHLCAHGGRPKGVASSNLFDLVLMDGGQGEQPTNPHLGRVLDAIVRRVRRNELAQNGDLHSVSRMLTHTERVALYGPETLT